MGETFPDRLARIVWTSHVRVKVATSQRRGIFSAPATVLEELLHAREEAFGFRVPFRIVV